MKIQATLPVQQVESVRNAGHDTSAPSRKVESDRVQLSGEARFIQELQSQVGGMTGVRQDAVQQAKADLASGQLGNAADLEATVDALMAGL